MAMATTQPTNPASMATTLPLIPHVVEAGMPLLAVCRGFQEMNVAFGGALWQKLEDEMSNTTISAVVEGSFTTAGAQTKGR